MNRADFDLVSKPFLLSGIEANGPDGVAGQFKIYQALLNGVRARFKPQMAQDHIAQVLDTISGSLKQVAQVNSNLWNATLVSPSAVEEHAGYIQSRLDRMPEPEQERLLIAQVAAIIAETAYAIRVDLQLNASRYRIAIEIEIASYASWHSLRSMQSDASSPLEAIAKKFEQDAARLLNAAQEQISSAHQRVIELQNQDVTLRDMVNVAVAKAAETLRGIEARVAEREIEIDRLNALTDATLDKVSTTESNLASFRTAIIEEVRGTETRKLWKERDVQNWRSFGWSSLALLTLLVVMPAIGLIFLDWVIATLRHIGDAAVTGIPENATGAQLAVAAVSRLVIITFPLVLYLWVIRLIVRFNSRSLLLHDDARQRQTMMDTYFLLVERNAATPEERGLVLNALFRPAPGHGADNVEAPKFTDLLPNLPLKN